MTQYRWTRTNRPSALPTSVVMQRDDSFDSAADVLIPLICAFKIFFCLVFSEISISSLPWTGYGQPYPNTTPRSGSKTWPCEYIGLKAFFLQLILYKQRWTRWPVLNWCWQDWGFYRNFHALFWLRQLHVLKLESGGIDVTQVDTWHFRRIIRPTDIHVI